MNGEWHTLVAVGGGTDFTWPTIVACCVAYFIFRWIARHCSLRNAVFRAWMIALWPLAALACLIPGDVDEDVTPLDAWRLAWDLGTNG